jgi:hypothetical protein
MSTDSISPPSRSSSPAAQRMRHYRKQRRQGLRSIRILLDETDIDALIRMRLLKEDQRQNVEALQTAASPTNDALTPQLTVQQQSWPFVPRAVAFMVPSPCLQPQAYRCSRRRHQARRPPLAKIRPGSPAPTMRAGTGVTVRLSKANAMAPDAGVRWKPVTGLPEYVN